MAQKSAVKANAIDAAMVMACISQYRMKDNEDFPKQEYMTNMGLCQFQKSMVPRTVPVLCLTTQDLVKVMLMQSSTVSQGSWAAYLQCYCTHTHPQKEVYCREVTLSCRLHTILSSSSSKGCTIDTETILVTYTDGFGHFSP